MSAAPAWVRDAVFYQIFPDRFARSGRVRPPGPLEPWDAPPTNDGFKGGDLYGVIDHLDHLIALGVTAIYLTPIFASASNHRYHTYDYYRVDPLLGGDEAFRALLDAAHGVGIRVVIDAVFNHCGRGFWPFHHVLEAGGASPYVDWFKVNPDFLAARRPIDAYPVRDLPTIDHAESPWLVRDGTWSRRELGYQAWWDLPALPTLNVANPEVREYLLGVAEHWIRFGADGWRLDVPDLIGDDFWREFRRRVRAVDPEAYIVAEIWDARPEVLGGDMYDGLMNYPLGTAIISFAGGAHIDAVVAGTHAKVGDNVHHDDGPTFARRVAAILDIYGPDVAASQLGVLDSHDMPRVLTLCGGDVASVRLATLIQMTLPGAPSIYYGDEIGLPGGFDPDCRRSFPWDRPETWDRDLLAYVSATTRLRHENPVLRHGTFRVLAAEGTTVAYLRAMPGSSLLVAVNNGESDAAFEVALPDRAAGARLVPLQGNGPQATIAVADGRATLFVPARSGGVFHLF